MAVIHNPEGEYAKELKRWDTPKRLGGYGPDGFEQFPKMLYKADRWTNGKAMVGHPGAATGLPEELAFSNRCQHTAHNGDEYIRARNAGWCDSPEEALEAFEEAQQSVAREAAEAKHKAVRMSEKANAEFDAAQVESEDHVPDPEAPKKAPKGKRVKVGA